MDSTQGMTEQELRDLILTTFEYTYLHDDWSHPLAEVLAGITPDQAAWRPGPDLMGIWDMVLHLTVWNDNIIERIQTGQMTHPSEGAWPPKPVDLDEANWDAAKSDLWASTERLKDLIQTVPFEKIRASPYSFADLACRFTHMAYHIGQIVKLRECQGW